jgi:hypothetical protein
MISHTPYFMWSSDPSRSIRPKSGMELLGWLDYLILIA